MDVKLSYGALCKETNRGKFQCHHRNNAKCAAYFSQLLCCRFGKLCQCCSATRADGHLWYSCTYSQCQAKSLPRQSPASGASSLHMNNIGKPVSICAWGYCNAPFVVCNCRRQYDVIEYILVTCCTICDCERTLMQVWRTSFGLGAIPLLFILYWRIFKLRESTVWSVRATSNRRAELALLFKHYWHRLLASGGTWFLVDFAFYGNKIFQSTFISILSPGASLFVNLLWTLLNSG